MTGAVRGWRASLGRGKQGELRYETASKIRFLFADSLREETIYHYDRFVYVNCPYVRTVFVGPVRGGYNSHYCSKPRLRRACLAHHRIDLRLYLRKQHALHYTTPCATLL